MKVVGIILLVAVAYVVWRFVIHGDALVLIGSDTGKRVTASLTEVIPNEALVVAIDNNDKKQCHHGDLNAPGSRGRTWREST